MPYGIGLVAYTPHVDGKPTTPRRLNESIRPTAAGHGTGQGRRRQGMDGARPTAAGPGVGGVYLVGELWHISYGILVMAY